MNNLVLHCKAYKVIPSLKLINFVCLLYSLKLRQNCDFYLTPANNNKTDSEQNE